MKAIIEKNGYEFIIDYVALPVKDKGDYVYTDKAAALVQHRNIIRTITFYHEMGDTFVKVSLAASSIPFLAEVIKILESTPVESMEIDYQFPKQAIND